MKRILCTLVVALSVVSLVGCGGGTPSSATKAGPNATGVTKTTGSGSEPTKH